MKDLQDMMNKRRTVQPVDAFDLPLPETESLPSQPAATAPELPEISAIPHTPTIAESQPEPAAITPQAAVATAQNQPIAIEPETVVAPALPEEIAINQSENVATENITAVATTRQTTIAISREEDNAFSHSDAVAIYDDKISALKRTVAEAEAVRKDAARELISTTRQKRVQGPSRKLYNALKKLPDTPQTAKAIEMVRIYPELKKPGLNAPESFHKILGELAEELQMEARKTNKDAKVTATDLYQEFMFKGIVSTLKKMTKKSEESPE